jgi:phage N-6-adenine-methyltransferase
MSMPSQQPGASVQEVGTPPEFLCAVEGRFGKITWDLAANESNHVVPWWFGPGSQFGEDSLTIPWTEKAGGLLWLNPPFGRIAEFAAKCKAEARLGAKIIMLIPASVSTNWFAEHVYGFASVRPIRPRLTFVGHKAPFPKDLMLALWNVRGVGFCPLKWR